MKTAMEEQLLLNRRIKALEQAVAALLRGTDTLHPCDYHPSSLGIHEYRPGGWMCADCRNENERLNSLD